MTAKLNIFDFDDTIVRSMEYWLEQGKLSLEKANIAVPQNYMMLASSKSMPDLARTLKELYPKLPSAESMLECWDNQMLKNYQNNIELVTGAKEFLTAQKNSGHKLILVSGTSTHLLSQALEHFELDGIFDYILSERETGLSKRNPKFFEYCMKLVNADASDTEVYEDSVYALRTAKEMGIKTTAVRAGWMSEYADEIEIIASRAIDNFFDLNKNFAD